MMTQRQYEFFKYLFDSEDARFKDLIERGKVYLTVATAYLGVLAFKNQEFLISSTDITAKVLFCLVALFFLAALVCIVFSLAIYKYEGLCDPEKVLEEIGSHPQSDDTFFDLRTADMAVAHNRNQKQNDRRADCLAIASWLMAIGVLFHVQFVFAYFNFKI
jgi:hypothetical protein